MYLPNTREIYVDKYSDMLKFALPRHASAQPHTHTPSIADKTKSQLYSLKIISLNDSFHLYNDFFNFVRVAARRLLEKFYFRFIQRLCHPPLKVRIKFSLSYSLSFFPLFSALPHPHARTHKYRRACTQSYTCTLTPRTHALTQMLSLATWIYHYSIYLVFVITTHSCMSFLSHREILKNLF